jgi:peptidoglycan/LPS O-acetylase OafA/YrhL
MLVLYHHSVRVFLPVFAARSAAGARQGFIEVLSLGFFVPVSFFFLLSGYVLSFVYLGKGRAVDTRRFFVARFARLYPLYFAVLILSSSQLLWAELQHHSVRIALAILGSIFACAQPFFCA